MIQITGTGPNVHVVCGINRLTALLVDPSVTLLTIYLYTCNTMRSAVQSLAGTICLRRCIRSLPKSIPRSRLPSGLYRPITIQAKPQSADEINDPPNFEIVDDPPSPSNFASSSQHPFSTIPQDPEPSSSTSVLPARTQASALPQPPSELKWTRVQHPFDTHAFVNYLEKAGLKTGTSTALMEAVRTMIVRRSDQTRESMMAKEDTENVSFCLFSN